MKFDGYALTGVGLIILAVASFTGVDALVKYLGEVRGLASAQILFLRSLIGVFLVLPFGFYKNWSVFKLNFPRLFAIRGGVAFLSSFTMYFALTILPLGQATALFNLETAFLIPLGIFFLGENVGVARATALMLSFLGLLIILRPEASIPLGPGFIAAFTGFLLAVKVVLLKKIATSETRAASLLWLFIISAALSFPFSISGWQTPSLLELGVLGAIALMTLICQWLMIRAYQLTDAIALAPAYHLGIPAALVVGFMFFNEIPSRIELLGITMILVGTTIPTLRFGKATG